MSSPPSIRLSQLTAHITAALDNVFRDRNFWIIADVTSHTFKADKNYHHFDLVEKDPRSSALLAKVSTKAWGKGALSIGHFQHVTGQRFTNNIQVLVNVSVNYHPVFGLQLNLNDIDINFTLGALEQQRQATLDRLVRENPDFIRKEGEEYLTYNKDLPLSRVIQRIAVITSPTSAGWQDFRHTLDHNPRGHRFLTDEYFTLVQGESNANQLVATLVNVFQANQPYDLVVIIRGGGAQTDLLLFDDYNIGKAIAKFPVPVITGIGHQKNETIADLMAHTATKTPTKTAEFIINRNYTFEDALLRLQHQVVITSQQRFSTASRSLARLNNTIVHQSKNILQHRSQDLLLKRSALPTLSTHYLKNQQQDLEHRLSLIRALSPENTLKRGFAIIKAAGRITSHPDDLEIGKDIEVILANKTITSTVKSKTDYDGNDFNI